MEREGSRRPPALWIDLIRAQGTRGGRRKAGDLVLRNGTAGGLLSFRAESEVATPGLSSQWRGSKVLCRDSFTLRLGSTRGRQDAGKGKEMEGGACTARSTRGENKWNILGVRTSHRHRLRPAVRRIESAGLAGRCTESPARGSMPTPARRLHGEGKGTADRAQHRELRVVWPNRSGIGFWLALG